MKHSVHAIPHQSFLTIGSEVPIAKKSSFPPGEAKGGCTNSPKVSENHNCLLHPSAAAAAAQLCIKRLYAVEDSYTC